MTEHAQPEPTIEPIAVIGMACRVPGARNIEEFWQNLVENVESIRALSEEEILAAGINPKKLEDPQYVRASPVLDDIEGFDAELFGFTRREAEILDPQHRLFLECAAAGLDHAGYDPTSYLGEIGVYAGAGSNEYQWNQLVPNKPLLNAVGRMAIALANHPDYLSTLVSYKLNLRGPSLTVHTACSTGLVAVHLACEAVRNGECDMALAGAVSIELTQEMGYLYNEGGILSPDGHCRTFDVDAQGTLWGSGSGVVVLKRLSDAVADGDTVHAVILGSAVNNDGSNKVGFSAPSVAGQAQVISQALGVAGADPSTISYVEAHGTATAIGDPIEISALTDAFRRGTQQRNFCALGAVKPNIGHLAAAAGVVGLIKTVLALEHETLPATLHFKQPHPKIDFESSPFRVVAENEAWPRIAAPRRAGVSSFGMGGTNAHVVLEEAPPAPAPLPTTGADALVLSAKTSSALDTMTANVVEHLRANPGLELADVAHTLQYGRRAHEYRRAVVCTDVADAVNVLSGAAPRRIITGRAAQRQTVFMFPGQGVQRVGMLGELYEHEAVVREAIDACAELLRPELGFDLREVLYPAPSAADAAALRLDETATTQPAVFAVDYALAKLWMSWGVMPDALIGHSLGEYVAACIAGVFPLDAALRLVSARARLMSSCPPGAMLAVHHDVDEFGDLSARGLSLAALNGPSACAVSGPAPAIEAFETELEALGVPTTRLRTSHAFHSPMMEPIRARFAALLDEVELGSPTIPILSNLTAGWLTAEQATSPKYWTSHMCQPVRFGPGLAQVMGEAPSVLLEVGPGSALCGLARLQLTAETPDPVATLPRQEGGERAALLGAAAALWARGVLLNWGAMRSGARRRVPMPGHPFEHQRYWIEDLPKVAQTAAPETREEKQPLEEWFWVPGWRQTPLPAPDAQDADATLPPGRWLVFGDDHGVADRLVARLRERDELVVTVTAGAEFASPAIDAHVIRPEHPRDYERLLDVLESEEAVPTVVVHAWALGSVPDATLARQLECAERDVALGFSSLMLLAQALAARGLTEGVRLDVVTSDSREVVGGDLLSPARAMVTGPCRVFPLELAQLTCRHIDLSISGPAGSDAGAVDALLGEMLNAASDDREVAYRGGKRWVPTLEPTRLQAGAAERADLRPGGVYLITGGLGGVGLSLAQDLARRVQAKLVLVGRSGLPPRAQWHQRAQGDDRQARQVRDLLALEQLGSEVLVLSADVADSRQMAHVREQAIARFGAVHGIIHAAGVAGGTMVEAHSPEIASRVLAPKVTGTFVLAQVFEHDPLDFLVLCSSVTALAGGIGQVDYCAANAFMDAFASARCAAGAAVYSVNWGSWLEVGMAVETEAPAAFRDIQRGTRPLAIDHPLLELGTHDDDDRRVTCSAVLNSETHWALDEHRIHGTPVLPGTGYLEMVRAAFDRDRDGRPVELYDVVFLSPLAVADGDSKDVRVVLHDEVEATQFTVESVTDGRWQVHARGAIGWGDDGPQAVHDLDAIRGRCPRRRDDRGLAVSNSGMLTFGPRWSSLQEVFAGDAEEIALLQAGPAVCEDLAALILHPALLDEATAFGDFGSGEGQYLPLGYGRITVRAPMPPRIYSHLRYREGASKNMIVCDIVVTDDAGNEIVDIRDFMLRQVDAAAMQTSVTADGSRHVGGGGSVATATSVADDDEVGIRPEEGGEALLRLLGARPGAQVVVSAKHMPTLIKGVARLDVARLTEELDDGRLRDPSAAMDLPDDEYVAPTTELERSLVKLWEDAIGARGIGIEHDFFVVGGDSLVAVQLMSRVRATIGVKLPMRSLFESPTIAGMAQAIEASLEVAA